MQAMQRIHFAASVAILPSIFDIASVGQIFAHAPHDVHVGKESGAAATFISGL